MPWDLPGPSLTAISQTLSQCLWLLALGYAFSIMGGPEPWVGDSLSHDPSWLGALQSATWKGTRMLYPRFQVIPTWVPTYHMLGKQHVAG
jgi:hypothetical protein